MSQIAIPTYSVHNRKRPLYFLYQAVWEGFDWLFPPKCGGCGTSYSRLCRICRQKVLKIHEPFCDRCGIPMQGTGLCSHCLHFSPPFTALRSCTIYEGPIRNAIHRLKYNGELALGETLSRYLISKLAGLGWAVDFIVPVPGGLARKGMRGYNQASLLALPVALFFGIQYRPKALVKIRDTRSQVGLSIEERYKNVQEAFQARPELAAGKTVLVIDDVVTSGATMQACGRALLEQGASQVYGLTLARAVLENHL